MLPCLLYVCNRAARTSDELASQRVSECAAISACISNDAIASERASIWTTCAVVVVSLSILFKFVNRTVICNSHITSGRSPTTNIDRLYLLALSDFLSVSVSRKNKLSSLSLSLSHFLSLRSHSQCATATATATALSTRYSALFCSTDNSLSLSHSLTC